MSAHEASVVSMEDDGDLFPLKAIATAPTVEVLFNLEPKPLGKEMTLDEIIAKEGSYLREDAPLENKETYSTLLGNFIANKLSASARLWREVGDTLHYMTAANVPSRLGFKNLEEWLNVSVRPLLAQHGCDQKATGLLQWMNYSECYNRIGELSAIAGQNLQEVSPKVNDMRTLQSLVSNPGKTAKGVTIDVTDEMKEHLMSVAAQAIADVSMEEPDPEFLDNLPQGKTEQDILISECRKTVFKMTQEVQGRVLAEVAKDVVDLALVRVGHFYEFVGDYSYFMEEEDKDGNTKLKKVKFDFKGINEEDRWVEVMSFDPDDMTVEIRPWIYYGMEPAERIKKDMHENGTLRQPVSVCLLNFKEDNKIALTQEDLENQAIEMTIVASVSRGVAKRINKALRNKRKEHPGILEDMVATMLEEAAREFEAQAIELSAQKKVEAIG